MNLAYWAGVFFSSALVAVMLVVSRRWHERWTGDFSGSGIQKHHLGAPPRIGLLALLAGLAWAAWGLADSAHPVARHSARTLGAMLLAASPIVLLGLVEDLTKRISPRTRLAGAAVSALLGMALLQVQINRVDIPVLDSLVAWPLAAGAVTLLMVCGFTNAMNIVDGLNGLAGGLAGLMLAATAAVAWQLGDPLVLQLCGALGLAVLGFWLVNWPRGLVFLGDGGAYLIGFSLAQVWILLGARHADVSMWFFLAVAAHPTVETIFSIWRRKFMRARPGSMTADRLHLHSLVYRRQVLPWASRSGHPRWLANGLSGLLVAALGAVPMGLALLAPDSSAWCAGVCGAYTVAYIKLFRRLTRRVSVPLAACELSSAKP